MSTKLLYVVCRVSDEQGENHLANIEPVQFLDLLSASAEPDGEAADLLALEAELQASRVQAPAPVVQPPAAMPKATGGIIVLPRAAAEPIVTAKTRGEVYEKLDELLSQFGARLAKEGE